MIMVLDTSTVASAIFWQRSTARRCLLGLARRQFKLAVTDEIAAECTLTGTALRARRSQQNPSGPLAPGLSFDAGTRQITGRPTEAGVFTATLSANYAAWGPLDKALTLRVIYPPGPPAVIAPIGKQTLVPGGAEVTVPLSSYFADRDTEQAVRFATSKGDFDVALYTTATPHTVSNFLNYVKRGDDNRAIVHRAATNFVVQGGGFKPAPPGFTRIPTDPSPPNEPGVQNLRGTVAMAKLGGDPDSATDQWLINLSDNSANLDNQNGGFTAFGRVCGEGVAVAEAIAALPHGRRTVNVDGQSIAFTDWPMDTTPPAPEVMDHSKLVLVNSVTTIEPLTYAVTGDSASGLVASAINATDLVLTPTGLFGGSTLLIVTATDLDGNRVAQPVTVELDTAYTAWLSEHALEGVEAIPGADPEGDSVPNAVEFVLGGFALVADASDIAPAGSIVTEGGDQYAALTFKLRKDLSGATVVLEVSSTGVNADGTPVWTSEDLSSPLVGQSVDEGDLWQVTVRDATSFSSGTTSRFLRLLVKVPE